MKVRMIIDEKMTRDDIMTVVSQKLAVDEYTKELVEGINEHISAWIASYIEEPYFYMANRGMDDVVLSFSSGVEAARAASETSISVVLGEYIDTQTNGDGFLDEEAEWGLQYISNLCENALQKHKNRTKSAHTPGKHDTVGNDDAENT